MTDYYQEIVTQASWDLFIKLKEEISCLLIGGWAVYLWTNALKSKDIDIIVDFPALNILKQKYDVYKNEHLRKYEIKKQGIDIDIYVPYYSVLALPVEEILKQRAYFQRKAKEIPELSLNQHQFAKIKKEILKFV